MIERFHNQLFQKMSPERRARKLSVMKTLARASLRLKNKENEDPLMNNGVLPISFNHSTPVKSKKVTERITPEDELYSEMDLREAELYLEGNAENNDSLETNNNSSEPTLMTTKIYDLKPQEKLYPSITKICFDENNLKTELVTPIIKVTSPTEIEVVDLSILAEEEKPWKSLEVIDESPEQEFCKSLENSKLVS